jgi:hypothetical protein
MSISATFGHLKRAISKGDRLTTSTRNASSKSSGRPSARPPVVRRIAVKPVVRPPATPGAVANGGEPEPKLLFQKHFKSIGRRTYATQIKELANRNHLLVLTEAKRDAESGDVRKTRIVVFGEDILAFFRLLHETATFIRANPLPEEVKKRRERFWAKKNRETRANGHSADA